MTITAAGLGLEHHERLRTPADFRRVFRSGMRVDGPLFLLVGLPNRLGHDRIGLAASRKMGGATVRNRAKRLLRESFRRSKGLGGTALDLILVPKRDIVGRSQGDVQDEYRRRLVIIARRRAARGGSPAAAPPG